MPRTLSSSATLDNLKKEAKRWLKALRARDQQAFDRLRRAYPDAPAEPSLRDVQHALATEYGLPGWPALKQKVSDIEAQRGATPRDIALQTLLRAAEQGDASKVAEVLDAHPEVINERGALSGHTGLRTALHFGVHHHDVVKVLLERGADPNIRDEGDNAFPLHFAAERGGMAVVRLLVEHGAQTVAGEVDDHELDIIGWATAFESVRAGREIVDYLVAHGARHTIFSAVATGEVQIVRQLVTESPALLQRRMDRVSHRRAALHLAVVKRQSAVLDALLDLGADPEAEDAAGLTALDQAALAGQTDLAQLLIGRGAKLRVPAAVMLRRTADLERLLREDPDALRPGGRWGTLIVRAAGHAPGEIIETLIRHGASPNVIDSTDTAIDETTGYTPLHAAAWNGNMDAAAVLLRHGANPRVRDGKYCGTPAGWADYNGKRECCDLILNADTVDIFDAIALNRADRIAAILERDPEALHRPFGAYASCEPQAAHLTPLAWATFHDNARAVRMLSTRGAELGSGGNMAQTHEERIAAFLRMACLDWAVGGPERSRHTHAAARLLQRHPEIARAHLLTAVVCGELDLIQRLLAERPAAAGEPGGPRAWPPLLYLCSARLPRAGAWSENAVAIARTLLDCGADPNVYYEGGNADIHYTALTCLIGRGEEQAAVHPRARELAALLLERGAEPYDMQFFYNAFAGHASQRRLADDDFVWLLDLIHEHSLRRGRRSDWDDPEWKMLDMGGYGFGAWYLLSNATRAGNQRIVEWALAHGARDFRGDIAATHRRDDIFAAAEHDRVEKVASILDAGVSPNVEQPKSRTRPLHVAAYHNALRVVRLLIERGAEIDPRDAVHHTTPIYWAYWGGSRPAVDLLASVSRDVWALVSAGKLDRLRELIAREPTLAKSRDEDDTVLFYLPDDEETAAEIVRLLLAHGADPAVRRKDGTTAAQVARARGLDAAAELLRL